MVNATQMAKSFNKEPKFWLSNQSTADYLTELSKVRNLTLADLVIVTKGGNNSGTWMHEDVALEFARWLSPAFAIWCNDRIKELLTTGIATTKPLTPAEQLLQNAQILVEQEKRLNNVEERVLQIEAKTQTRPDYYTVVGYGTLHGISVNLRQASSIGRKASKICKERGICTDSMPDPRFGIVRLYPSVVLEEIFNMPLT